MRWIVCAWSMADIDNCGLIRFDLAVRRSVFVIVLLLATPVLAEIQADTQADIQAGVNALGRGNYPKALEIFHPLAESGDWNAQGYLAHTYKLMEDNREAYAWYHAMAKCGSKDALIEISIFEPKLSAKIIEEGKTLGDIYHDRYCR